MGASHTKICANLQDYTIHQINVFTDTGILGVLVWRYNCSSTYSLSTILTILAVFNCTLESRYSTEPLFQLTFRTDPPAVKSFRIRVQQDHMCIKNAILVLLALPEQTIRLLSCISWNMFSTLQECLFSNDYEKLYMIICFSVSLIEVQRIFCCHMSAVENVAVCITLNGGHVCRGNLCNE